MSYMNHKNIYSQTGQSMVEYIVVVFFSVLLLAAPLYDPDSGDDTFKDFDYAKEANSNGRKLNAVQAVQRVMQDNYNGYSYAMSLSEFPNELPLSAQAAQLQGVRDQLALVNGGEGSAVSNFVSSNLTPSFSAFSFPSVPP